MQTVVIVIATAAQAQILNDALREQNNGDAFQAGLVPAGSPAGTAPTHFHASWGEDQWRFLAALKRAAVLGDTATQLRTDRTTARIDTTGVLTFRVDDTFSLSRALTRLGLEHVNTDVDPVVASPKR